MEALLQIEKKTEIVIFLVYIFSEISRIYLNYYQLNSEFKISSMNLSLFGAYMNILCGIIPRHQ